MEKNGTPASPAMALARSVLPVPGGPTSSTPLGMRPPSLVNFFGFLRNSTISVELLLGLVDARHVLEGDLGLVLVQQLGPALAEGHGLAAAALHLAHEEDPHADQQQHREPGDEERQVRGRLLLGLDLERDVLGAERAHEVGIVGRGGLERRAIRVDADEFPALHVDFGDPPLFHRLKEIGVGNGVLGCLGPGKELVGEKDDDSDESP